MERVRERERERERERGGGVEEGKDGRNDAVKKIVNR